MTLLADRISVVDRPLRLRVESRSQQHTANREIHISALVVKLEPAWSPASTIRKGEIHLGRHLGNVSISVQISERM
jgi:hypothetical protein